MSLIIAAIPFFALSLGAVSVRGAVYMGLILLFAVPLTYGVWFAMFRRPDREIGAFRFILEETMSAIRRD